MTQIVVVPERIPERKATLPCFGCSLPAPDTVFTYYINVIVPAGKSDEGAAEDMQDAQALRDAIAAAEAGHEQPIPLAEVRISLGL
jgi:hypothetical protein